MRVFFVSNLFIFPGMKDFFSRDSSSYAKYRPQYPERLIQFISAQCSEHHLAWDCATGNGQAAQALSNYFNHVHGTDISNNQLKHAVKKENITYSLTGINCPAPDRSVDLVTVAQAYHWLDAEFFFKEVRRVATEKGIIAVWTYTLLKVNERIDAIIKDFYENQLRGCWDEARRHVDEGYANLPFPFRTIPAPEFNIRVNWNADDVCGFLNTWSAIPVFIEKYRYDPIPEFKRKLKEAWGTPEIKEIIFPLYLKIGYVH